MPKILLFLSLLICKLLSAQTVEIGGVSYGEDLVCNEDIVLVSGITFREDGNNSIVTLSAFSPNLKPIWKKVFDSHLHNRIDGIVIHANRIIITGYEGVTNFHMRDVQRFVRILDFEGNQIKELKLKKASGMSADMMVVKNKIYIADIEPNSSSFTNMTKGRPITLVEIDLNTFIPKYEEYQVPNGIPRKILTNGSDLFIVGNSYENYLMNKKGLFFFSTTSSQTVKYFPRVLYQQLKQIYFSENELVVFYVMNEVDIEYKIDHYTKQGDLIKSEIIPFQKTGCVKYSRCDNVIPDQVWINAEIKNKQYFFIKLNANGQELERVPTDIDVGRTMDFGINKKALFQIYGLDDKLWIKKIKR